MQKIFNQSLKQFIIAFFKITHQDQYIKNQRNAFKIIILNLQVSNTNLFFFKC